MKAAIVTLALAIGLLAAVFGMPGHAHERKVGISIYPHNAAAIETFCQQLVRREWKRKHPNEPYDLGEGAITTIRWLSFCYEGATYMTQKAVHVCPKFQYEAHPHNYPQPVSKE